MQRQVTVELLQKMPQDILTEIFDYLSGKEIKNAFFAFENLRPFIKHHFIIPWLEFDEWYKEEVKKFKYDVQKLRSKSVVTLFNRPHENFKEKTVYFASCSVIMMSPALLLILSYYFFYHLMLNLLTFNSDISQSIDSKLRSINFAQFINETAFSAFANGGINKQEFDHILANNHNVTLLQDDINMLHDDAHIAAIAASSVPLSFLTLAVFLYVCCFYIPALSDSIEEKDKDFKRQPVQNTYLLEVNNLLKRYEHLLPVSVVPMPPQTNLADVNLQLGKRLRYVKNIKFLFFTEIKNSTSKIPNSFNTLPPRVRRNLPSAWKKYQEHKKEQEVKQHCRII